MTRRLICPILMFLPLATAAHAEFGDCTDETYLAGFVDAPTALGMTCVEQFRFSYSTPEGPREIRAISDAAVDWAVPADVIAGVQRGAREAAAATAGLGRFAIDDVTLLILDDRTDWGATEGGEVQAFTDGRRTAAGGRPGECLVTLYGLASGGTPEEIAVTVAHEYFHCLQYATLSAGQMGSYGAGGTWWIEGAAEYFSAMAVTGSIPFTDRSAAFDAAVAADVALNDMEHESSPFFFWLGETQGLMRVMDFQRGMADSNGADAQRAAMRGALSDNEWLDFAKAYAEARIAHPQGGQLGLVPDFPLRLQVEAPGSGNLPALLPFALYLGTASYDCGVWGNELDPGDANLALRPQDGGDWQSWPDEVDAREGGTPDHQIAGLHTGDAQLDLAITVERRQSCRPCAEVAALDACLMGTWKVLDGGPEDWMAAQGLPMRSDIAGPQIVTYLADGGFATEPFGVTLDHSDGDVAMQGEGWVTVGFGNWSAAEGRLNICQTAGGMHGTVTISNAEATGDLAVSAPGAGQISMSYSCAGSTMETVMEFPRLPDMVTTYGKIAELPEALPVPAP